MTDFAAYLREKREAAGLSQVELAGKVGLTGSYISILENRKKPPPSDAVLERLSKALEVDTDEILEVAHLDRSPDDIRKKIKALDRRLRLERKVTKRLLTDLLPSSLWHFWTVRGMGEYGLERIRLDGGKKRILRKVLRRIGHLTSRDDFVAQSRKAIEDLPDEERAVLAEVLPELAADPVPANGTHVPVPDAPAPIPDEAPPVAPPVAPPRPRVVARDEDMLPRVEKGDSLLVEPDLEPAAGDLVLVSEEGRTTVRQVAEAGERLLLVAANPSVRPRTAAREEILGVVVEIRRRLRREPHPE